MKIIEKTAIVLIFLFNFIGGVTLFAQNTEHYRYRGVELCASTCHNSDTLGYQYAMWKNSAHSKSYITLASKKAGKYAAKANIVENPQESAACLKCHITGAGLDTSYYRPTYRKEDGVTCEACHKVKWKPQTIMPDESTCLNCHNDSVHKVPKFDFKDKSLIITHHGPDEKFKKNRGQTNMR